MQRELFNNMFRSSLYTASVTTGPLRGGHDADVAHGENEFDTPALNSLWSSTLELQIQVITPYGGTLHTVKP